MANNEDKLYSQTQLSKELNISQSTVTRLLRKNGFKPIKTKGRTKLYSEDQFINLSVLHQKDRYKENTDVANLSSFFQKEIQKLHEENEKLEKSYSNQLKSKDEQIAALHKLLDQNQQLLLNTQEENKKLLALQAPAEDTQHVQDGDFKEQSSSSSSNAIKDTEAPKDEGKEKHPWWKLWK